MENDVNTRPRSPEEERFNEYVKTGDDFKKIEIYRLAKHLYSKALETGIETEALKQKIILMEQKIKSEERVFAILGIIAFLIVVLGCTLIR